MGMGVRVVIFVLVAGALWNLFTIFYGLAGYFDLPLNPNINPVQFTFAVVLTAIVFGFVLATHLIWGMKQEDLMVPLLRAAWGACIAINLVASWQGTKNYVFYGDNGDAARGMGLALATALTVSSTIFLSMLTVGKDLVKAGGKDTEKAEGKGAAKDVSKEAEKHGVKVEVHIGGKDKDAGKDEGKDAKKKDASAS